ncbi:hypothetical protein ACSBR2_020213 [Camellia fascicularis]
MALMATTKSKISNLLCILSATHKTPSLASGSYSNGAARKFWVAPFGGSGRPLSSSVAPLESDMVSLKDYEEYRKALYRRAYEQSWGRSRLRYVKDGRPFWQYIVSSSTGCSDSQYFEELYNYYTTEKAWHLCDPDAEKVFKTLRNAGVKLAVVSNFDTRLRPVLRALNCNYWFDAVAVSAEVEAEKPNPTIFIKACELLEVKPEDAVHVGDDRRNDIWGCSKDRSPGLNRTIPFQQL